MDCASEAIQPRKFTCLTSQDVMVVRIRCLRCPDTSFTAFKQEDHNRWQGVCHKCTTRYIMAEEAL